MPDEEGPVEYRTVLVGQAYVAKQLMARLGVVKAIDEALATRPDVETTYGTLAQVIIANRMAFAPEPLYHLDTWAAERGLDHVFGIESEWLDDDRIGGMLELLADNQATIWGALAVNAVKRFAVDLQQLHGDTTSVYFEGSHEEGNAKTRAERERTADKTGEDGPPSVPLLVHGYNKDGQHQCVQMVLSVVTAGRVPLWYQPWDGNTTDDKVYLADMNALRQKMLVPGNALLIGDRKLCNKATMLGFCSQEQLFLAPHPWTDTMKALWRETQEQLRDGRLQWVPLEYTSRNNAGKPDGERPHYRVCEVVHRLMDERAGKCYPLRLVFSEMDQRAEREAKERDGILRAGEEALQKITRLLGRYDYKTRKCIERHIERKLKECKAGGYFTYTLDGSDQEQNWALRWERREDAIADAGRFDGIAAYCTNAPAERLSACEAVTKYKEQGCVEQTIEFIKDPVAIRPLWLHKPKRVAGLILLVMIAVLVASLLECQVRRWIAKTGRVVKGLMPENRDNPYPTARAILKAFADYALVLVRHGNGEEEVHYPKLRPVQQQIWDIMESSTVSGA